MLSRDSTRPTALFCPLLFLFAPLQGLIIGMKDGEIRRQLRRTHFSLGGGDRVGFNNAAVVCGQRRDPGDRCTNSARGCLHQAKKDFDGDDSTLV